MSLNGPRRMMMAGEPTSGAWSPLSVSGCTLWLDGDDSATITHSSNAVSQWTDKSTNGFALAQGTGSAKPTTNTVTQNGKNGLSFDGGDVLTYSGTTGWDLTNLSLFVVYRVTTFVSYAGVVVVHASTGDDHNSNSSFNINTNVSAASVPEVQVNGATSLGTQPITVTALRAAIKTGTSMNTRKNAVAVTTGGTVGGNAVANGGLAIAGRFLSGAVSGSYRLNGAIFEIIGYSTAVSDTDRDAIESYLNTKWAIY